MQEELQATRLLLLQAQCVAEAKASLKLTRPLDQPALLLWCCKHIRNHTQQRCGCAWEVMP